MSLSLTDISQSVSNNSLKDIFLPQIWKTYKTFITVVAVIECHTRNIRLFAGEPLGGMQFELSKADDMNIFTDLKIK